MKFLIQLISILLVIFEVKAQEPIADDSFRDCGYYSWDVISDYQYILIDTTIDNNIWQVGNPTKSIFISALSLPNAIITDTINTYPVNNESYFYLKFIRGGLSGYYFTIKHRYDTDYLIDGGTIELSFNNGINWYNIFDITL